MLWNHNIKRLISNLPYTYFRIRINLIINDSVLQLNFDNRTILLSPNNILHDTVVIEEMQGNKLVSITTVLSIENLGIMSKENTIDNSGWETKSLKLGLKAPRLVDSMPVFRNGNDDLIK